MVKLFRHLALALGMATLAALPVAAQDFPSRPIKLQIPFGPGGATDILARMVAEELSTRLGQPVVSENRPGASTAVAAGYVAKAKPDGYTLLFSTATHAINAATSSNLSFDAVNDFEFIGKVGQNGFLLMANPKLKLTDMKGLIELARSQPGKLQFGSAGTNSQGHLWTESLLQHANVRALHVPYKSEPQVLVDLIGGELHFFVCTISACGSRVNDGTLTTLAVTTPARYAGAPNVPTVAEAGFPDAGLTWWAFVAAPKGTPAPVIQKLNTALNDVLADDKFRKRLLANGVEPETRTTPASLRALVQTEVERWRGLGIKEVAGAN